MVAMTAREEEERAAATIEAEGSNWGQPAETVG